MDIPQEEKNGEGHIMFSEETGMTNKYICTTKVYFMIREIQRKIIRYHFSSTKLANFCKNDNYSAMPRMKRNRSSHLFVGNANRKNHCGDNVESASSILKRFYPLTICSNLFSGNNQKHTDVYVFTLQHCFIKVRN